VIWRTRRSVVTRSIRSRVQRPSQPVLPPTPGADRRGHQQPGPADLRLDHGP
jgi:hypothetical protein